MIGVVQSRLIDVTSALDEATMRHTDLTEHRSIQEALGMSMPHSSRCIPHILRFSSLDRRALRQSNRTTFRPRITMPIGDFVDRVMDIIELLADEPNGLPLSEIARRLDMPKSAAHRLLSSLVNRGFAVQDDHSQRYRLS